MSRPSHTAASSVLVSHTIGRRRLTEPGRQVIRCRFNSTGQPKQQIRGLHEAVDVASIFLNGDGPDGPFVRAE